MRNKLLLFLKIFLATGIPFGLIFGLPAGAVVGAFAGQNADAPWSPWAGAVVGFAIGLIVAGLPFGLGMALILGFLQLALGSDPKVRHRRTLIVDASFQDARALCIAAIGAVNKTTIDEARSTESAIVARKGVNLLTRGDAITCTIESNDSTRQAITVESRPVWKPTLVDCGSNLKNVEAIVQLLVSQGARLAGSQPQGARGACAEATCVEDPPT